MASLFNIGVNGLQAQQTALNVVGQNITNASTPGYSRQRADMVTQPGASSTGVFSGGGVRVDQVTRIADRFITDQIRADTSRNSELDAFTTRIQQMEAALFDDGFGIDTAIRDFFTSMDTASANPLDGTLRQFVLDSGDALADRFQRVSNRINQQVVEINNALGSSIEQVNQLGGLIANVNKRIADLQDSRDSSALNLMTDRRDELLKELSTWVGVSTSEQGDGQLNVFVGKGQSLVLGAEVSELVQGQEGTVLLRPSGAGSAIEVTGSLAGGSIGGLLAFREDALTTTQNRLGHLAMSVATAFNDQHGFGIDLNGEFGVEFFRDINDPNLTGQRVAFLTQNSSSSIGTVRVRVDDPQAASPADYELRVGESGSLAITRRTDGEIVYQGAHIEPPLSISFDGLTVDFTSGSFAPGDALLLRPYASAASDIAVALTDPAGLALAAPVALGSGQNNQGDGALRLAEILDPEHPLFDGAGELMPPLLLRFVSTTQFELLNNADPTNPVPLDPDFGLQNFLPGQDNHVLPYAPGSSVVSMSGPDVAALPANAALTNDLNPSANGYAGGSIDLAYTDLKTGVAQDTEAISIAANSSAKDIAAALDGLVGVHASAQTTATLTDLVNYGDGIPVEFAVNGELITGFDTLADLADAINGNDTLASQGIEASSDGATLVLLSRTGEDLNLHFQGDPNESIRLQDEDGGALTLNGNLAGTYRHAVVGGRVSTLLAPGVNMSTQLSGLFAANPVHERADFGVDLLLTGSVAEGDEFTIDFNAVGSGDNRNALALSALAHEAFVGDPPVSFGRAFAGLVQTVGAASAQAATNLEASAALLDQSLSLRESVSGVNLDEEAANLIRFEQAYNASAQIISVARDIFNVLLNSVT